MKYLFLYLLFFPWSSASSQTLKRTANWMEDISYFDNQLRSNHKNLFHHVQEAVYNKSVNDLKSKIDSLSDFDIVVGLSKISATIGDSHTFLHPEGATQNFVPLIISMFEDGFYVIRAKPAYKKLVQGRLIRVNDNPVDEVYKLIRLTISADLENEMSYKFLVTSRLTSADLLLSLGIINDVSKFTVTILTDNGKEETVDVSAVIKEDYVKDDWVLVLAENEQDRALAYQHNQENYWQTFLPVSQAAYCQYNKCENGKDQSIKSFFNDFFETVSKQSVKKIILDLRRNTGGNEKLNWPIISGLKELLARHSAIKVIVLMGRATHSAACNLLLDLEKQKIPVTTIGETGRSKPNFYSENHFYTLPHSKIRGSVSSLFRKDSFDGDERLRIEPDISVPVRFSDYASGKDAVMEKALRI
ncbi:MAG: hypothetical protein GC171_06175 [Terrimonas sp.]|nr:hypothetical protein [Terrimonas sp.]